MDIRNSNLTKKEKHELQNYIRRRNLVLWVLGFMCLYLLFDIISIRIRLSAEQKELDYICEQIEIAQEENDELVRMMSGDKDEYIERIAREKLGYAAVDERVFEDVSGIG